MLYFKSIIIVGVYDSKLCGLLITLFLEWGMDDAQTKYDIVRKYIFGSRMKDPPYNVFQIKVPYDFKLIWIMIDDFFESRMDKS